MGESVDKQPFDFVSYMGRVVAENRLAQKEGFAVTTCSGIEHLEGMLDMYQTRANFVCTSDVCQESLFTASGGWFKRRVFTVFVLARYAYGDGADYAAKMGLCRELFRQMCARFIRDSEELQTQLLYLNTGDIRSNELGGMFLNGCTGLYFMLSMDEPTDLVYNAEEWL